MRISDWSSDVCSSDLWVIPKGWPKKGRTGWRTAEEEAYEEAGVLGRISQASIGRYRYIKWMPDRLVLCSVTLFPLRVDTELDNWPEQGECNCMRSAEHTTELQ